MGWGDEGWGSQLLLGNVGIVRLGFFNGLIGIGSDHQLMGTHKGGPIYHDISFGALSLETNGKSRFFSDVCRLGCASLSLSVCVRVRERERETGLSFFFPSKLVNKFFFFLSLSLQFVFGLAF